MRFWIEEIGKLVPYRGYYDFSKRGEARRGKRHSKRVETMRQKLASFRALRRRHGRTKEKSTFFSQRRTIKSSACISI